MFFLKNDDIERNQYEINVLRKLRNKGGNVLFLIDDVKIGNEIYIVMNFIDGLNLSKLLDIYPDYAYKNRNAIVIGCFKSLKTLQDNNIIHGDLPNDLNIMIDRSGDSYIVDYGAGFTPPHDDFETECADLASILLSIYYYADKVSEYLKDPVKDILEMTMNKQFKDASEVLKYLKATNESFTKIQLPLNKEIYEREYKVHEEKEEEKQRSRSRSRSPRISKMLPLTPPDLHKMRFDL